MPMTTKLAVVAREDGLLRRFAPRNDDGRAGARPRNDGLGPENVLEVGEHAGFAAAAGYGVQDQAGGEA